MKKKKIDLTRICHLHQVFLCQIHDGDKQIKFKMFSALSREFIHCSGNSQERYEVVTSQRKTDALIKRTNNKLRCDIVVRLSQL